MLDCIAMTDLVERPSNKTRRTRQCHNIMRLGGLVDH